MADFANDEGVCWPAIATLASKARCSESWVHQTIRELRRDGCLEVVEGGGRGKTNIYRLTPHAVEKGAFNAPLAGVERVHSNKERVHSVEKRVHPSAPDPSIDPSYIDPPVEEDRARTRRNIFVLYEASFGHSFSPMERERMIEMETEFPAACVEHSFREAAELNKRSLRYVDTICKNHLAQGDCYVGRPGNHGAIQRTGDAQGLIAVERPPAYGPEAVYVDNPYGAENAPRSGD